MAPKRCAQRPIYQPTPSFVCSNVLPNAAVYTNGDVCISILHEPGEDVLNPQVRLPHPAALQRPR